MSGMLYGVGFGFGDLELMILKVYWLILLVEVIVCLVLDFGESFVCLIVVDVIFVGCWEILIVVFM